ncbi:MAG: hypothetical protein SGJ21_06500 [Alphaproteobacteria bacterium]|nr:hypothetical protein [Alphaproteobacteria bacterium]
MPDDPDHEILLEYNRIGPVMEVRAVSGTDGLEIRFAVPARTARADVEQLARNKLSYARGRSDNLAPSPTSRAGPRGGILV